MAGSAAAGWQASMGVVEAGSLFAWCQSAAMGGAAVNGIIAAGAAGGAVLLGSTATALMDGDVAEGDDEKLMKVFRTVCRRVAEEEKAGSGTSGEVGLKGGGGQG